MIIERKYLRGVSLRDTSIPRIYLRGEAGGAPISFEGYPLELDVPNARSMRNYTIFGNTSEDAKGVGDEVVQMMATNNYIERISQGVEITRGDNCAVLNGTTTARLSSSATQNIPCVEGHRYLMYSTDNNIINFRYFKSDSTTAPINKNNVFVAPSDAVAIYANYYDLLQTAGRVFNNYKVFICIIDLDASSPIFATLTTADEFAQRLGYADAAHLPAFPYGSSFVAPIRVGSRNLLDNTAFVKGRIDNGVIGYESGTTELHPTSTGVGFTLNAMWRGVVSGLIPVKSTTIHAHYKGFGPEGGIMAVQVHGYDKSGNYVRLITSYNGYSGVEYNRELSIEDGSIAFIRLGVQSSMIGEIEMTDFCVGYSAFTDFVPYFAPTLYSSVLSSPLHKIGDIVDYKESNGKEWHGNGYEADMSQLPWQRNTTYGYPVFRAIVQDMLAGNSRPRLSPSLIYVNGYEILPTKFASEERADKTISVHYSGTPEIIVRDDTYSDLASFVASLKNIPLVFALATPTEVQGEPLPLLAIPKGESIVTLDTEVEPSNITAKV